MSINTYAILRRSGWPTARDLQEGAERPTKVGS